jgi:serine/threonine-protein kinase
MTYSKALLFSILGIGAEVAGFGLHTHIVKVNAAKLASTATTAPYFPPAAPWTQDISHAPLDPNSDKTITWLASVGGWGFGRMQSDFSLRVIQATPTSPVVPFKRGPGFFAGDSDYVSTVPLPAGGGMEGEPGYECPVTEGDCHFIVVDRAHAKLYEAWEATYTNGALSAQFLAVWDLNRVYPPNGRGEQCTSADAAGLPMAPLLFNADELAAGKINHALRFILPNSRIRAKFYVHPATHAGAPRGPLNAPAMGARFRLKPTFDVSQLTPAGQVVARAMQKYGMFLSDGGNITLTAQSDQDTTAKYATLGFGSHDMQAIKVTDFEVVDSGPPTHLSDECVRNRF